MLLNEQRIEVIEEFLKGYNAGLTGSTIAEKRGLNQKLVGNILQTIGENTSGISSFKLY